MILDWSKKGLLTSFLIESGDGFIVRVNDDASLFHQTGLLRIVLRQID